MALHLVTMGTGSFAVPTLLGLYQTNHEVVALFTQPDRTGRGHHHHENTMKSVALEHRTPVFQPVNANSSKALEELRALQADLYVVAAYGQILSDTLLAIPRLGAINVHASLLPKYRGAAPIQHAILHGEKETGVTIFQIEPTLDAGPILAVEKTDIGNKETAGELEERLADVAVGLTIGVINHLAEGTAQAMNQDTSQVTKARRLKKGDGAVDWNRSAVQIGCHVRAMQPWPNPFTFLQQTDKPALRLILLDVEPASMDSTAAAGTVLQSNGSRLVVQSGDGAVEIVKLQPEGKAAMMTADFLRGHVVHVGDRMDTNRDS